MNIWIYVLYGFILGTLASVVIEAINLKKAIIWGVGGHRENDIVYAVIYIETPVYTIKLPWISEAESFIYALNGIIEAGKENEHESNADELPR